MLSRRDLIKTMALSTATVGGASALAAKPYNVLFLMSDEHSPHVAGCFGNQIVQTPAIDSLARNGAAFHAAYCQNPVCVPSRASFLTGRMPWKVGVFGNTSNCLDNSVPTMADVFSRAGYVTAWMGKTHWGGNPKFITPKRNQEAEKAVGRRGNRSRLPQDASIADYPIAGEIDTLTKNQALRFLEQNRSKRFFAGVSFRKPHFPFLVQERYFQMYKDRIPAPHVTEKMIAELPLMSQQERETYGFASLKEPQIRRALSFYYGMVTYMDELVEDVLKKVDELGLRENTIILYTADHGELGGEHGLWYKNSFYEGAARIPHVWSFPKEIPKGIRIDAPTMNMDIFPTLCDLCGLEKPSGLEGHSLVPLMKGKEDGKNRYALSESFRGNAAGRMIRSGPWKYCHFKDDREQLFNLKDDPGEAVNLFQSPQHRDLVEALKSRALGGDWDYAENLKKYKQKAAENRKNGVKEEV